MIKGQINENLFVIVLIEEITRKLNSISWLWNCAYVHLPPP